MRTFVTYEFNGRSLSSASLRSSSKSPFGSLSVILFVRNAVSNCSMIVPYDDMRPRYKTVCMFAEKKLEASYTFAGTCCPMRDENLSEAPISALMSASPWALETAPSFPGRKNIPSRAIISK